MPELRSLKNFCRQFYLALFCLAGAGLGGCASEIPIDQSPRHVPMKLLVLQSPMHIEPTRLQKVFAPDSKKKLPVSAPPIAQGIKHSQEYAQDKMVKTLRKLPHVKVVTPATEEKPFITKFEDKQFDTAIPQKAADQIHTTTGADEILRFGITDYGLTPTSWRTGYITFEVVSTLAITALIASAGTSLAKGTAGAYLAQETVEETAESYAGFWALDVVCRPVRIEAKLIQLQPVQTVWESSDTGLSDVSLSRMTRKVGTKERDMQLDQSTDYAVNKVVSDLSDSLGYFKPIHKPHSFANGR
jgi:hypothetical protein